MWPMHVGRKDGCPVAPLPMPAACTAVVCLIVGRACPCPQGLLYKLLPAVRLYGCTAVRGEASVTRTHVCCMLQAWSVVCMKYMQTQNCMVPPAVVAFISCVFNIACNWLFVGMFGFVVGAAPPCAMRLHSQHSLAQRSRETHVALPAMQSLHACMGSLHMSTQVHSKHARSCSSTRCGRWGCLLQLPSAQWCPLPPPPHAAASSPQAPAWVHEHVHMLVPCAVGCVQGAPMATSLSRFVQLLMYLGTISYLQSKHHPSGWSRWFALSSRCFTKALSPKARCSTIT